MLENILNKVASEFSSKKVLEYLLNIYRTDHWFSFHSYHQTSDYCYRRLAEFGLEPMNCFTNDDSCERILFGILRYLNEKWAYKKYMMPIPNKSVMQEAA